jgi:uncharacterized hydrophobic protein (TIGR00271 family)
LARSYFALLLRVSDKDKLGIYVQVFRNAEFAELNYWLEVIFSIGIATLGLIINSPAVVIGAMLISPLMGPIIASGLAIALGDFYLGLKAITNVLLSILASVLFAALITWILPFRGPTPEILARIQPTILDLGVAVFSGMAGAIVVCRGGRGGGVTALPGVAVAVALMPPLAVVGFGVGVGWDWSIIRGGGLLFLTNLVAIILSSFVVFLSVRMDAPAVRLQISDWLEQQEKSERFYEFVERTPLRQLLGKVGTLPRRLLILLAFLASVAYPLQQSLVRLTQEAQIRRVVLDNLHEFIPRESVLQEDVEVLPDRVRVRVVAVLPGRLPPDENRRLEESIRVGTGRRAEVVVYNVATREDLATLMIRLSPLHPAAPQTVEEMRTQLVAAIGPAVVSTWPSDRAPLLGYLLSFDPDRPAPKLQVVFLADQDLGPLGQEAVRKTLRERTGTPSLDVAFERVPPAWHLTFRPRSSALSAETRRSLDEVAAVLRRFPRTQCVLRVLARDGKTLDALAKARIHGLQEYLVANQQVPAERIQGKSFEGGRNDALVEISLLPQR